MHASLPYQFFIDPILHTYHYDRALRASTENGKKAPIERNKIPRYVDKRLGKVGAQSYDLKERPFVWSRDVPDEVVNVAAAFMRQTAGKPPDALWIADYVRSAEHYDPIIYASFGPWQVEVARWD
jgi:hypothetical protein